MSIRSLIIYLSILTTFTSWSLGERQFKRLNDELKNHVNKGKLNKALQLSDHLLTKKLNENQRYQILTTKSKIHFWTENLFEYNRTSKQAYEIKKKRSEIYKAYYFAQKAAYFHYHILGDSAVYYSDKSIELLKQNWTARKSVPFYFIYQIYGTVFLYRNVNGKFYANSEFDYKHRLPLILNYQDTALSCINQVPHFKQEKAIIYRSKGNRIMDLVGYTIRNKKSDFKNYNFQLSESNKAIKEYYLALSSLSKNDSNFSNGIKSLIALVFYCTNRQKDGDEILWPIIKRIENHPIHELNAENIQLLNILQTFTQNIISKKSIDSRIYSVMRIYNSLRSDWYWYLISKNKNYLDSYGQSPPTMLSLIKIWLDKLGMESSNLSDNLRYEALNNYIHYSKSLEKLQNKKFFKQEDKKFIKQSILNYLDIKLVQKKLEENSALLVQIFAAMEKQKFILVTKNNIKIDTFQRWPEFNLDEMKITDLSSFKKTAYKNFLSSPFSKIVRKKKIKKLYVAIDVKENFDMMILDTIGDSFDNLNYFKRKINVVKIYNPIDFFAKGKSNQSEIANEIVPYLINSDKQRDLLFSKDIFLQFGQKELINIEKVNLFEPGIAHIIGHGKLKLEKDKQSYTNESQSKQFKKVIKSNTDIKLDLLVLNFCFAAYKRNMFYPDRDLQNNLISRGAKAVIASPYETVDQSSAWIFKKFYRYIKQGITVEDALHKAKLDYLKSHKGSLAHPIYWSTFELTTNVRDLKLNLESEEESDFSKRIWTISTVLFSLFVISLFLFKLFRKSLLN
ncbi:MAG: CHAT domain-containing protein [Bacteroidetes bacterium]|nr:CHAT domain-containing protein [Bacteroidota bacterium]